MEISGIVVQERGAMEVGVMKSIINHAIAVMGSFTRVEFGRTKEVGENS